MSKTRKDPHKYYYAPNKVICVSTYAGKVVRGVAKCAPNDTYDQAFGEKLAKARCDFKIAKARYARARAKKIEAIRAMNAAIKQFHKMEEYCKDSDEALVKAINDLMLIEGEVCEKK